MKRFLLPAVWSKRHPDGDAVPLPPNFDYQLATHQVEVFQALQREDIDVVFDTAMTGDGKTLAAHLPVLTSRLRLRPVFIYPTNELIRDQDRQAKDLQKKYEYTGKLKLQILTGRTIDQLAYQNKCHRYDAVENLIYGQKILLTNPDLFTLINDFKYRFFYDNASSLAERFNNNFRYLIFDEFHTYETTQISDVIDEILIANSMKYKKGEYKYLFLSATPNYEFIKRLEGIGLKCHVVQGKYQHGSEEVGGYRRILQEVQLDVAACNQSEGGIVGWVDNNIDQIEKFYQENEGSKGAIICNSVLAAKRLVKLFEDKSIPHLEIVENTGLTGEEARKHAMKLINQDGKNTLLIATSTVDVGVDFRLNYLIFEALDAGSFIQRLGRLGRGAEADFSSYQAIALLPDFLVERLEKYEWEEPFDRQQFFDVLREKIYPKTQQFSEYYSRWGGVRALKRSNRLREEFTKYKEAPKSALYSNYLDRATNTYKLSGSHFERIRELQQKPPQQAVLDELEAFRGSGRMDVWVFDPKTEAVTTMNILRVLRGTQFTLISKEEAKEQTEKLGMAFYPSQVDLYFQIDGYLEEKESVALIYPDELISKHRLVNIAQQRGGFKVDIEHPELWRINKALQKVDLCTCVLPIPDFDTLNTTRRILKLPSFFEIHLVKDSTKSLYVVAFGQDALLLDSIQHWRKVNESICC